MSHPAFSDQQLQAYLDEALPAGSMAEVERQLRISAELRERLVGLVGLREAGVHGLGEIWRRHRLSCPDRSQLGSYLLGILDAEEHSYIEFHLEQVGCRWCGANLQDLRQQQAELAGTAQTRRRKYFQTSVGYLPRQPE